MAAITRQSLPLDVQREKEEHKAFAMVVTAQQMQNVVVVAINENGLWMSAFLNLTTFPPQHHHPQHVDREAVCPKQKCPHGCSQIKWFIICLREEEEEKKKNSSHNPSKSVKNGTI